MPSDKRASAPSAIQAERGPKNGDEMAIFTTVIQAE